MQTFKIEVPVFESTDRVKIGSTYYYFSHYTMHGLAVVLHHKLGNNCSRQKILSVRHFHRLLTNK